MGLIDFTQFVNELATVSGQAILPFFRTALIADDKGKAGVFDPVTEADRAGEAAMRHLIKRHFPTHGIVGEEHGETKGTVPIRWIVDPIDGTKTFVRGVPLYGTLVGVEVEGDPKVGVIYLPALD